MVSQLAKEQPMSSVDTAAWWVEYVLQHDTTHFKSPAMKHRWWQKRLLDVWLTLFIILAIISLSIYKTVKFVLSLLEKRLTNRTRLKEKKRK